MSSDTMCQYELALVQSRDDVFHWSDEQLLLRYRLETHIGDDSRVMGGGLWTGTGEVTWCLLAWGTQYVVRSKIFGPQLGIFRPFLFLVACVLSFVSECGVVGLLITVFSSVLILVTGVPRLVLVARLP